MASPLSWFRKNQKSMLIVFGVLLMVSFLIAPILLDMMQTGGGGGSRELGATAVSWRGAKLTNAQLDGFQTAHYRTVQFLEALMQSVGKDDPSFRPKAQPIQAIHFRAQQQGVTIDEAIVRTILLAEEATNMGLVVNDKSVLSYLSDICDSKIPSNDERTYKSMFHDFSQGGMAYAHMIDQLRTELLAEQMRMLSFSGVGNVTPGIGYDYSNRVHRQVKLEVLPVYVADFVDKIEGKPTERDLRNLYEDGKRRFASKNSDKPGFRERRKIAVEYIKADYDKFLLEAMANVTDDDIEKYNAEKEKEFDTLENESKGDSEKDDGEKGEGEKGGDDKKTDDKKTDAVSDDAKESTEKKEDGDTKNSESKKQTDEKESTDSGEKQSDDAGTDSKDADKDEGKQVDEKEAAKDDKSDVKKDGDEKKPDEKSDASDDDKKTDDSDKKEADEKDKEKSEAEDAAKKKEETKRKIAEPIAKEAMKKALEDVEDDIKELFLQYIEWEQDQTQPRPQFDVKKIAKKHDLEYGSEPLLDVIEIGETEIGQSFEMDFRETPFAEILFNDDRKPYSARVINNQGVGDYLYWKTEIKDGFIPEFEEIRDKVEEFWRFQEARKLANEAAEAKASEARDAKDKPLKDQFKDDASELAEFSWLSTGGGNTPFGMMGGGIPEMTEVFGVDRSGVEFMQVAYSLRKGEIGVAPNSPKTAYYVIRSAEDGLRDELKNQFLMMKFFTSNSQQPSRPQGYEMAAMRDRFQFQHKWMDELVKSRGVKWERDPQ